MLKKIDVLLPDGSLYDVLCHFTRKLFEALVRAGFSCRLLEGNNRFLTPLESPPDCTICFNGALRVDDGKLFCDLIHLPHISCLVDPPFYFPGLTSSRYVVTTCDDRSGCEYLHGLHYPNAFFMPHAVERELAPDPNAQRIYDVVMLSTFVDYEKRRAEWKDRFPAPICRGMEEAAEIALQDEAISFPAALKQALAHCLDFQSPAERDSPLYQTIFSEVERYIKGRDKIELLDAIQDTPVHVFGSSIDKQGWAQHCAGRPNVTVHSGVSYSDALKIMQKSKIILNSSIKNKYGAHERIFSGSACGAVVATNDNPYLREHFAANEEIILYRRSAFDQAAASIKALLSDEERRKEVAERARQKVLANHTWDHRIAQLFKDITPTIERMAAQKI